MTSDEYFTLLNARLTPRLVEMAREFAALAEADSEAADRKIENADVIFAVWRAETGGFGFIPVFGAARLGKRERSLRLAALFAPSEIDALMLASSGQWVAH